MPLTLHRIVETFGQGTLGQLTLPDDTTLFTMERNAAGDHPRVPAGLYELKLDMYHKGNYPAYQLIVPGRDRILIHAANVASELEGCISPGFELGYFQDHIAVLRSRAALAKLMQAMQNAAQDYITIQDNI